MAEPFKNLLDRARVADAAQHLRRAWPAFDARRFERLAATGLGALEMKARAMQIADALEATLPADFDAAAAVIEAALGPAAEHDRLGELQTTEDGLAGWILWPVGEFVARRGLSQPRRALATLRELTQRFSAEFAIRPFIARHPALAFATLRQWTTDPNLHVRRLVSEGSRPRLPWGMRLRGLIADPSPTLPLLQALQDDTSGYVRRSVANHLNDIAKDHPERVAAWVEQHLPGASAERRALLRHASRTLVKQGYRRTLAAWGLGEHFRGSVALAVEPARVALGGALRLGLTLRSRSPKSQPLVIDYTVHHLKASGATSPKVFKGWRLELAPRASVQLEKRHALKPVSIRRYFGGRHAIEVQVNGERLAEAAFVLEVPEA